ncbi:hypothetical protein DB30_02273 [Enhygromyxa salina]|uniref:Uncharacterized protein n=1 Tax=Enhygromyxa salina TaxID=215803 RepID=A0A0C1ZM25_9BACT|nr:hypothetical protein [Enhygromyxa salina]KIG11938.1 hypothetical protein DB30_02273 [Enhygromyxa salina]
MSSEPGGGRDKPSGSGSSGTRTVDPLRPERIAAISRALGHELLESIALAADGLADDLAERLGMVAWEREDQIGMAQRRLMALRERRFHRYGGEPALVRELREQPLEALELAWRALRRGRRVHVESEADACPGVFQILRDMSDLLGEALLSVSAPGVLDHPHADWQRIGVRERRERVALIQPDADHELAAYVLARACLRRTGFDPRVVHRVVVVGPSERLERNLRRLWVGTQMGPVDDEHAFAGPVTERRSAQFLLDDAAWRARDEVTTICPGGRLRRANAPGQAFLAPALFRVRIPNDQLPTDEPPAHGPILIVYPVGTDASAEIRGERLLEHFAPRGHGHLRFGSKPRDLTLRRSDRQVHGALLVERLPPGLPEPRP